VNPPSKKAKKPRTKVKSKMTVPKATNSSSEIAALSAKLDRINNKIPSVKGVLENVGSSVGGFFGNSKLGKNLGSKLSAITGFGDYQISSNSLIKGAAEPMPQFYSKQMIRFKEREYIGEITSAAFTVGAFNNDFHAINPSSPSMFPWLSTIATLYEQWYPHGIVFEFVSTSSEYNGVSQALGTVIMATDYNPLNPQFSNKQTMENADFANSTKPSNSAMHGVECDPKMRPVELLYVGTNTATPLQFSTLGNFQIATVGCSSTSVSLGELWISYDISFSKKSVLNTSQVDFEQAGESAPNGVSVRETPDPVAGSSPLIKLTGIANFSGLTFLCVGTFYVTYSNNGQNSTTLGSPVYSNMIEIRNYNSNGVYGQQNVWLYVVQVNNPGATMYWPLNTSPAIWGYTLTVNKVPTWFN